MRNTSQSSVADPDQGSGAFLNLDPGSRIPTHIFDSLSTNFWAKSNIIFAKKISLPVKNGRTKKISPSSFGLVVGSGTRDSGFGMDKNQHPGYIPDRQH
jgi:hypothetical protein